MTTEHSITGYTLVELILSGIYVWSLLGLLKLKSSIRQRRVMLDLIWVNVIIVLFDILVVILLYLNRVGISHPIQTFSYALKLKLEFVVLNQLMAVAARGLQRESFEERRYHHSSSHDAFSAECRQWNEKRPSDPQQKQPERSDSDHDAPQISSLADSDQLTVPEPVLSRSNQPLRQSLTESDLDGDSSMNKDVLKAERECRSENFLDDDSASSKVEEDQGFPGETLRSHKGMGATGSHTYPQHLRDATNKAFRSVHRPLGHDASHDAGNRQQLIRATMRRHIPRRSVNHGEEDEEEDEEIGVHMWENNGKLKLETPWFKSKVQA